MRFTHTGNRAPKLDQATSKDKNRPDFLRNPHLDAELAELQATNTIIAVRIPVDLDKGEATGPVDQDLLDGARKVKAVAVKVPKPAKPKRGEQVFPSLPNLWPSDAEMDAPAFRVGISASELKKLADAIGTDQVELRFPAYAKTKGPQPLRPILVRTAADVSDNDLRSGVKGAVRQPEGLIMPWRLRAEANEQPAAKKTTAKPRHGTTSDRSAAALKAVETRRRNAEAAAKGKPATKAKPAAKNGNGNGSKKSSVAAAIKAVGSTKRKPATRAKAGRNGTGPDRGAGSEARRRAALKAAATRRANLAAKK